MSSSRGSKLEDFAFELDLTMKEARVVAGRRVVCEKFPESERIKRERAYIGIPK